MSVYKKLTFGLIKNSYFYNVFHESVFLEYSFQILSNMNFSVPDKKRHNPDDERDEEKSFKESSDHGKRRRVEKTIENNDPEQIVLANAINFERNGNPLAARIIKSLFYSPDDPEKMLTEIFKSLNLKKEKISAEEALAKLISWKLTKNVYIQLSQTMKQFPCYDLVRKAKALAIPENILVSEKQCVVPLQSLLNHTAARLLKSISLDTEVDQSLTLICKTGFDGSSGHTEYKQVWQEAGINDSSIIITCLYPLQLEDKDQEIVWKCRVHASPYFNRIVRMSWVKETPDSIISEKNGLMRKLNVSDLSSVEILR